MSGLIQYTEEQLRTWRTSRLNCSYMNYFTLSQHDSNGSQLRIITRILRDRPIEHQIELAQEIGRMIRSATVREDYERAATLRDMLKHYEDEVMSLK